MTRQHKALRLAEELEEAAGDHFAWHKHLGYDSAALIRRQHALIEQMAEALRKVEPQAIGAAHYEARTALTSANEYLKG